MSARGRRIVVTGAGSGIGLATCELHRARQDHVVGLDVQATRAADGFPIVDVDLRDPEAVERAIATAATMLGGIDVLVCCAGVSRRGSVETTEAAEWDDVFAVNVRAAYLCARAALPHLRQGRDAAIVNVASQFGLVATGGYVAYCASKAALIHLTRAMAVDHGPEGIRVNAVCPGPTETPMLLGDLDAGAGQAGEVQRVIDRTLSGRPSRPDEIAEAIAFLGSGHASSAHGAVLAVDAGYSIH
ncbi:MAG TPA: SDR family oxidoreductase [Baekduia sp.]|uniref:SDR family NAD(P)-dependent oxidoreductase n=1 Tax=Baekduia sp. TaxID=2600305 RepID=UPI002D792140|nr:SDR family oxidoreductase [Baekduia sp.]HET6507977.1 SDR family oxidoreductase [Baekduia sp.]